MRKHSLRKIEARQFARILSVTPVTAVTPKWRESGRRVTIPFGRTTAQKFVLNRYGYAGYVGYAQIVSESGGRQSVWTNGGMTMRIH